MRHPLFSLGYLTNSDIPQIVNTMDPTVTQTYAYDNMNRLISGQAANRWGNTYTYDAFGNLYQFNPIAGLVPQSFTATPTINNQLAATGLVYDGAGNMYQDNVGNVYHYDAENRVATVGAYTYGYDGDGNRVTKSGGSVSRGYWFGAGGEVLNEFDLTGNSSVRNVYLAGQLRARRDAAGNVHYLFGDQIGSARTVTNSSGVSEDNAGYYPYGQPTTFSSFSSGNLYKFTGRELDAESGLDYFGARYYASSMGRWMSPDWAAQAQPVPYAKLDNPQTLNLYSYVGNNPLSQVDADGHFASPWHFLLTFVAAVVTGHDPITAAVLGVQNALVDVGTQGPGPADTHIHDMGSGTETPQQAYDGTVQTVAGEQSAGNVVGVQHTVQDGYASGHEYQTWPGSFSALGLGGTLKHELGDWLPSPGRLWGALKASINAFRHPDAAPQTLLAPAPAPASAPAPAPTPAPTPPPPPKPDEHTT